MKVIFAVVWLLANGQFQGEPWRAFDDMKACQDERDRIMPPVSADRLLFFTACVDTTLDVRAEAFHFDVTPAKTKE
jgi:hypothetical protein